MSDDLRSRLIRLAHESPGDVRDALLPVLKQAEDMDSVSLSIRGERAGKSIEQAAKNLQRAMLKHQDIENIEKWMLRLFGIMLREGMYTALDGYHDDLAREAYALAQKMQQWSRR